MLCAKVIQEASDPIYLICCMPSHSLTIELGRRGRRGGAKRIAVQTAEETRGEIPRETRGDIRRLVQKPLMPTIIYAV